MSKPLSKRERERLALIRAAARVIDRYRTYLDAEDGQEKALDRLDRSIDALERRAAKANGGTWKGVK